jgi:NitT/TauT family transport system substrate-binding protein
VRLIRVPWICLAPQYFAEELLRAEGFTEIQYVDVPAAVLPPGKVDFGLIYASNFLRQIDADDPIALLSGVHVGCFELFANEGTHGVPELKGKTVGVQALGSLGNTLVLMMARRSGSTRTRTFTGLLTPPPSRSICSSRARLMHFWRFLRSPRIYAPVISVA